MQVTLVSTFHKAYDAEEKADWPRFRFLRILLYYRNQWSGVVFQFLVAIGTGIRVHEITEFNMTVGAFEFKHYRYLVKSSVFLGLLLGSIDVVPQGL